MNMTRRLLEIWAGKRKFHEDALAVPSEQPLNFLLENVSLGSTDVPRNDAPFPVNHERDGQAEDSTVLIGELRCMLNGLRRKLGHIT